MIKINKYYQNNRINLKFKKNYYVFSTIGLRHWCITTYVYTPLCVFFLIDVHGTAIFS